MPALDDVTQRFIVYTDEYVAALKAAADAAYEFAVANATATKEVQALEAACMTAAAAVKTLGSAEGDAAGQTGVFGQMLMSLRDIQADSYRNGILLAQIFELLNDRLTALAINAGITANATRNLGDQFMSAAAKAVALAAAQGLIGESANQAASGGSSILSWVQTGINFWNQWKNVIHWAVMGTLEVLATAVPALAALGAAMAAMYPTVVSLQDHFTNLMIASGGLHGAISNMAGPTQLLAGNMQRLNLNVAPDVWMIFGSLVEVVTQHMGAFSGIAQQASNVLGSFSAKIVSDLQGQAGSVLVGFFRNAVGYMIEWGQVLGNFADDFMKLMHDMPGVGAAFLAILNGIAKAFGTLLSMPVVGQLIGIAAAFSAVYRYATFAAGAMMFLFRITGIQAAVSWIMDFVAAVRIAATGDTVWGATLLVLSGELDALNASLIRLLGPLALFAAVLGPGILVAGLDIFLAKVTYTQSSIEQLISQLEKLPPTAQNLAENINTLGLALQTQTQQQTRATQAVAISNTQEAEHARNVAAQTQSTTQLSGAITKEYDSLKSLTSGLQALGYTNQQTANDMTILSIGIGIQDSKVQQLNQAWDSYLGMMIGGMSSLANFTIALGNMTSVTATSGLGNLSRDTQQLTLTAQQFAAALQSGATTPVGAAAWQNFAQVMQSNLAPLANWLQEAQTAGVISRSQLATGIQLAVAQMIPFTGTTGAAASILQEYLTRAGVTGETLADLQKKYPDLNSAAGQLNTLMAQASINMTDAEKVAGNLSAVFNTQLTNAIVSAALKASGFTTDVQNMMQAQMTGADVGGKSWQQWQTMAQNAMNEALGTAQKDTAGIVSAWSTVPAKMSTTYTVYGQVVGNVPLGTSVGNLQKILSQHGGTVGYQSGGMVGGASGVDAVHAMLTAGEAVLNARAVSALGGPLGVHSLNNQPSEAVLTSGLGGGGQGAMALHNHITVEVDGRQMASAFRVSQLTYDRRNPSPNVSLNRPGRPG